MSHQASFLCVRCGQRVPVQLVWDLTYVLCPGCEVGWHPDEITLPPPRCCICAARTIAGLGVFLPSSALRAREDRPCPVVSYALCATCMALGSPAVQAQVEAVYLASRDDLIGAGFVIGGLEGGPVI